MPTIIPVKFAYAARDLWFDPRDSGALEGDHVICSTERGTEIGLVMGDPRQISKAELAQVVHNTALKPVLRVATEGDLERADKLARKGEEAMPAFREAVSQSGLDMKPVGVEYLFGGEKVVCYFAADDRVDFRQLVRDLSRTLHERIDMRQIGVREEAAVIGGFGHCGEELCCSRFGLNFEPVSIRMAKEQDLPLTSNKISGACGRLMCCLRYEFEAYRDFKGRAPKRNAIIDTPLGNAKVVEYDTPKEQLALRLENGKVVRVPLAEMQASEAAVKKSEELHCACRPDTVLRSSLEKLNSPDVQMALAELDRKMGVVQDDGFDSADIFVSSKPRRRRNRSSEPAQQTRSAETTKEQAAPSERRTRRRRNKAEEPGASTVAAQAQSEADANEKRTRRRRRRKTNAGASESQAQAAQSGAKQEGRSSRSQQASKRQEQQAEQAPKESRRRRHHRSGAEASADATSDTNTRSRNTQRGTADEGQKQQRNSRPRRRPGDRAGAAAQTSKDGQDVGENKSRKNSGASANGQKNNGGEAKGEGTSKRRRRRRGGRGRGGNSGEDNSGANASSASKPSAE